MPPRSSVWQRQSTTPHSPGVAETCVVTHPFHPLRGQSFEVIDRRRRFGEDSILGLGTDGQLTRLAAAWTSAATPDPFVHIANQRALFRPVDLFDLRRLLNSVGADKQAAPVAVSHAEVITK